MSRKHNDEGPTVWGPYMDVARGNYQCAVCGKTKPGVLNLIRIGEKWPRCCKQHMRFRFGDRVEMPGEAE